MLGWHQGRQQTQADTGVAAATVRLAPPPRSLAHSPPARLPARANALTVYRLLHALVILEGAAVLVRRRLHEHYRVPVRLHAQHMARGARGRDGGVGRAALQLRVHFWALLYELPGICLTRCMLLLPKLL